MLLNSYPGVRMPPGIISLFTRRARAYHLSRRPAGTQHGRTAVGGRTDIRWKPRYLPSRNPAGAGP